MTKKRSSDFLATTYVAAKIENINFVVNDKKVIRNFGWISEIFLKRGLAPGIKEPLHVNGTDAVVLQSNCE